MNLYYILYFIVITCICYALCTKLPENVAVNEVRGYLKREHSLFRPFQGSGMGIPYWDFLGSTLVTSQHIRLTPDEKSRVGAIWNSVPCRSRDWEIILNFKVSGTTGDLFGDGFAFWYTKDRMKIGPVFGSIDYFNGLAIFADTYSNHNGPHNHAHPYFSAMVGNSSAHYDHDSDGTHTQVAGCESKFRNKDYDTHILIRYADDTLSVYHDIMNKGVWAMCFSVTGVHLPTGYYFGISAATGDLSDNHDILGLKMYEIDIPRAESQQTADRQNIVPQAQYHEPERPHVDDKQSGSWFRTILMSFFGLICVGAVLFLVLLAFQKRQERSRKRFY